MYDLHVHCFKLSWLTGCPKNPRSLESSFDSSWKLRFKKRSRLKWDSNRLSRFLRSTCSEVWSQSGKWHWLCQSGFYKTTFYSIELRNSSSVVVGAQTILPNLKTKKITPNLIPLSSISSCDVLWSSDNGGTSIGLLL